MSTRLCELSGSFRSTTKVVADRYCSPLLFADATRLANPVETVHLPALIVLHHIVVLSPLLLPHQALIWSEAEYVLWVQKHTDEREQWDLLERAVDDQLIKGYEQGEIEDNDKYVKLIREVLDHARHEDQSPGVG